MQAMAMLSGKRTSVYSGTWLMAAVILVTSLALFSTRDARAVPWDITKTSTKDNAPLTVLTLARGQTFLIPYAVTVAEKYDSGECVVVTDWLNGGSAETLGTTCATKTFTYSLPVRFEACGEFQIVNNARLTVTTSLGQPVPEPRPTKSANPWTINVTVPCESGCTLTQGYWKTHSEFGPAPYDDTWQQVGPGGAATLFYLSGKSYYQTLHTSPKGNPYWSLAHQFIAAELNGLNGASLASIQNELVEAAVILQGNTPAAIAGLSKQSSVLARVKFLAGVLDSYNNGYIGPGHCDDDTK